MLINSLVWLELHSLNPSDAYILPWTNKNLKYVQNRIQFSFESATSLELIHWFDVTDQWLLSWLLSADGENMTFDKYFRFTQVIYVSAVEIAKSHLGNLL